MPLREFFAIGEALERLENLPLICGSSAELLDARRTVFGFDSKHSRDLWGESFESVWSKFSAQKIA